MTRILGLLGINHVSERKGGTNSERTGVRDMLIQNGLCPMRDTRVMVVDDSAAMRALFSGILENAKGVEVCGVASSAAEARDMIPKLKPDVLTLDVEMPVMTGLEFLEEIMQSRPMPVVMLSSIAQIGSGAEAKALELGAVHCFPKPLRTTPEEFDAAVSKLGDVVIRAAKGELTSDDEVAGQEEAPFEPDGSLVVMASGQAGLKAVKLVISDYPVNCPPTIIIVDVDRGVIRPVLAKLQEAASCELAEACDGASLVPGKVYFAFDRSVHVIVEGGDVPRLRVVAREPVAGVRPSADLLLGSIARAQVPAQAGLLSGSGSDGAKGLQILMQSGGKVFLEDPAEGAPRDRMNAVHALGIAAADMPAADLGKWILTFAGKE